VTLSAAITQSWMTSYKTESICKHTQVRYSFKEHYNILTSTGISPDHTSVHNMHQCRKEFQQAAGHAVKQTTQNTTALQPDYTVQQCTWCNSTSKRDELVCRVHPHKHLPCTNCGQVGWISHQLERQYRNQSQFILPAITYSTLKLSILYCCGHIEICELCEC